MHMEALFQKQKAFFESGRGRSPSARVQALRQLLLALSHHEEALLAALSQDLGKTAEEAYMTEIAQVREELKYAIRRLRLWSIPAVAWPTVGQMPGHGRVLRDPYGVTLILSPWNYPVLLSLAPLVAAIAAGNTVILRPSAQAPQTARTLFTLLRDAFPEEQAAVVLGGQDAARTLLSLPFDKIFFTGSPAIGRQVLEAAAKNLTPVTLELGGKSPVVVCADADIDLAARRIVFAKGLNAGQTCVAPDYVLVARPVLDAFISAVKNEIERQFGKNPLESADLPPVISERHYERLCALLSDGVIAAGGQYDPERRKIAPTVLTDVSMESAVMQEEIFGPILPVLPFDTMDQALAKVRQMPHPLAFYLFTKDGAAARRVMRDMRYGGGCVNDCAMHLASPRLPFGGVGQSGMGAYHGKEGFRCFTRPKSVLYASAHVDLPVRYAPRKGKLSFLKRLLR